MITDIYFAHPYAFLLVLALFPVLYLIARSYRRNQAMLAALKHPSKNTKHKYVFIAVIFSVMLSSLAGFIAKPQSNEHDPLPSKEYGEYVLLADVSRSMAARSTPESQSSLDTTKQIMTEIVRSVSSSAKYQIFGYSKLAFPLSGLSNRIGYLKDTIKYGLYIEVIPEKGSDLANALQAVAYQKLEDPRYENVSHVVLFSDGGLTAGDEGRIREAISLLKEADISVIAVGIGSAAGQRIPLYDKDGNFSGEYEKLKSGETYIARLNERNLKTIAASTGGKYFSQEDKQELVQYIKSTLIEKPGGTPGGEYVSRQNDHSWIFLTVFIFALFVLLLKAGDLY